VQALYEAGARPVNAVPQPGAAAGSMGRKGEASRMKVSDSAARGDLDPTGGDFGPAGGVLGRMGGIRRALREFLYGMTAHEFARQALETRSGLETIFMVSLMGDMIGVPVMPPYYSLRLLPFVVPGVSTWKRRVMREHDVTSGHDYHLHGV
jgi:hypothetical protein